MKFINDNTEKGKEGVGQNFPGSPPSNFHVKSVHYTLAVWRFQSILSARSPVHSQLSGGLRLKNYRAIAGNQNFRARFQCLPVYDVNMQSSLRVCEQPIWRPNILFSGHGMELWTICSVPCVTFLRKNTIIELSQIICYICYQEIIIITDLLLLAGRFRFFGGKTKADPPYTENRIDSGRGTTVAHQSPPCDSRHFTDEI